MVPPADWNELGPRCPVRHRALRAQRARKVHPDGEDRPIRSSSVAQLRRWLAVAVVQIAAGAGVPMWGVGGGMVRRFVVLLILVGIVVVLVALSRHTGRGRGMATSTAGGPLTAANLAEVTGSRLPDIEKLLSHRPGRTLIPGRHRLTRGVPAPARRPLHRRVRMGERRALGGRGGRLVPGSTTTTPPSTAALQRLARRCSSRQRHRHCDQRLPRAYRHEDHAIGVRRFSKDQYTTLEETEDRILTTDIATRGRYNTTDLATTPPTTASRTSSWRGSVRVTPRCSSRRYIRWPGP